MAQAAKQAQKETRLLVPRGEGDGACARRTRSALP